MLICLITRSWSKENGLQIRKKGALFGKNSTLIGKFHRYELDRFLENSSTTKDLEDNYYFTNFWTSHRRNSKSRKNGWVFQLYGLAHGPENWNFGKFLDELVRIKYAFLYVRFYWNFWIDEILYFNNPIVGNVSFFAALYLVIKQMSIS